MKNILVIRSQNCLLIIKRKKNLLISNLDFDFMKSKRKYQKQKYKNPNKTK